MQIHDSGWALIIAVIWIIGVVFFGYLADVRGDRCEERGGRMIHNECVRSDAIIDLSKVMPVSPAR